MLPFLTFRAPNKSHWRLVPNGRKIFRVHIWVKRPLQTAKESNIFTIKEPITREELLPILEMHANEVMDILQCDLFEHWAKFLLAIDDETTDQQIDDFYDNFPQSDYGYECYIWR